MMNLEEIFITSVGAEENSPQGSQGKAPGGAFGMFLPMIFVFAIFYLLLIRPQAKQKKKHQAMVENLKKGDEVVTSTGIHGRIAGINGVVTTVEIAENVRIKLDKQQIAVVKAPQAHA